MSFINQIHVEYTDDAGQPHVFHKENVGFLTLDTLGNAFGNAFWLLLFPTLKASHACLNCEGNGTVWHMHNHAGEFTISHCPACRCTMSESF